MTAPEWAKFGLVMIAAIALATALDPYLGFASPLLAQLVNAVLPATVVLVVWGLSGRAWFALVAEAGVLALLAYADRTKVFYLNTDLLYADFMVLGGLLQDPQLVLGFVHLSAKVVALVALALAAVAAAWWMTRHARRTSWWLRAGCLLLGASAAAAAWILPAPTVIGALDWQVYQQRKGARQVGVPGNVLLGRMTTHLARPQPDADAERAFWDEPSVRAAAQHVAATGDGRRPDIVIVQSESLFAPDTLRGFADVPLLPHIVGVGPGMGGRLQVPVFGSRTLQTEFEVLSGAPIAFYPGSMFAYYELVDHRINGLPQVLDDLGYRTLAIHPNKRGFWNRGTALPDLGFGTFQDFGSFVMPRDLSDRGLVSDQALMRTVLAELDAANGPSFVFAISIENHGPWGEHAPKSDARLGLPGEVTGEPRLQLADYVSHAMAADRALGFLLGALERRGRPTVVLLYGDHLPALPEVYAQLGFKNGVAPDAQDPPYRVWANFPLPPAPAVTSAYLLQGWLLRAAGLPLRGHTLANALAGMVAADPAVADADKQRVLREYANVAAANVQARVRRDGGEANVFFDRGHALPLLLGLQAAAPAQRPAAVRDDDLYLDGSHGTPASVTFATDARLASLTLRPYVRELANGAECVGRDSAPNTARVTVRGDGRVLYQASVSRQSLRLATLDLRGVRGLDVQADAFTASGACAGVHLRVAQLTCYSARCSQPGPVQLAAAPAPSRILTSDPMGGDLAALAQATPHGQRARRKANMNWLLGNKVAQQEGLAPFRVEQNGRLFMHPADDHAAWMDFDVTAVDKLVLAPRIDPLDAECAALKVPGKEASVVGLTVLLDGKPALPRELIGPGFRRDVTLDTRAAHDLRIEVDKGNDVSWCDWFSVGVDAVSGAAAPPWDSRRPAVDAPDMKDSRPAEE